MCSIHPFFTPILKEELKSDVSYITVLMLYSYHEKKSFSRWALYNVRKIIGTTMACYFLIISFSLIQQTFVEFGNIIGSSRSRDKYENFMPATSCNLLM